MPAAPAQSGEALEALLRREVEDARAALEVATPEMRPTARKRFTTALERFVGLILRNTIPEDL